MTIYSINDVKSIIQNLKAKRADIDEALVACNLKPADYSNITKAREALVTAVNTMDVVQAADFPKIMDLVLLSVITDELGKLMVAAAGGEPLLECRRIAKLAGLAVEGRSKEGLFKEAERTMKALLTPEKKQIFDALLARRNTYAAVAHTVPHVEDAIQPSSKWSIEPYTQDGQAFERQLIARAEAIVAKDFNALVSAIRKEKVQVLVSPTGERFHLGRGFHECKAIARTVMADRQERLNARKLLTVNGRVVTYGAAVPPPIVSVRTSIAEEARKAAIEQHPHDLAKMGEAAKAIEGNLAGAVADALEAVVGK